MSSPQVLKIKSQFVMKVDKFLKNNFSKVSLENKTTVADVIIPALTAALSARGEEHGENVLYYAIERAVKKSPNTDKGVKISDDLLSESLAITSKTKQFVKPSDKSGKGKGLGLGGPKTNTAFSFTKTKPEDRFISDKQVSKVSFDTYVKALKKSHNVQIDEDAMKVMYEEANERVFNAGIKHAEIFLKNTVKGAKENANGAASLTENDIMEGLDYADAQYNQYKAKKSQKA